MTSRTPNNSLMYPFWPNYPFPPHGGGLGWPWPQVWQPPVSPRWPWPIDPDPVPPADVTRNATGGGVMSNGVEPLRPEQFAENSEASAILNMRGKQEGKELEQKFLWFILTLTEAQRIALLEGMRHGISMKTDPDQTRGFDVSMPWDYAAYAADVLGGAAGWMFGGSKDPIPWRDITDQAYGRWFKR